MYYTHCSVYTYKQTKNELYVMRPAGCALVFQTGE